MSASQAYQGSALTSQFGRQGRPSSRYQEILHRYNEPYCQTLNPCGVGVCKGIGKLL